LAVIIPFRNREAHLKEFVKVSKGDNHAGPPPITASTYWLPGKQPNLAGLMWGKDGPRNPGALDGTDCSLYTDDLCPITF
jgi:hypothetical protein